MSKNLIVAVVVILILAVGGFYFIKSQQSSPVAPSQEVSSPTPETQTPAASEAAMRKGETLVKITASGFNPQSVTIKTGDSVTWQNDDSANHNVNSDPHPTHTGYPPLNLGLIKPGDKKSLTFDKAGTYTYHDHLNPSLTGSVTVQ